MPKTEAPSSGTRHTDTGTPASTQRPGWLVPLVILGVVVVVVAVVVGIIVASGDDAASPEAVVESNIAAVNARDLEAYEATMDPDIVITYDGSTVGIDGIPAVNGRDAVMENATEYWNQLGPTVTYEVLTVDDETVITEQVATVTGGGATRHEVTYEVSADGLIVAEHHVILE